MRNSGYFQSLCEARPARFRAGLQKFVRKIFHRFFRAGIYARIIFKGLKL